MFTEAYLEPSQTSMRSFFTSLKPYFIHVLDSIEFPLGFIFNTTYSFAKKLTTTKMSGEKGFFFEIQNYAMEWGHQKKMD